MSGSSGLNRTGTGMSPVDAAAVSRAAQDMAPRVGGGVSTLAVVRSRYAQDAEPIGSLPLPTSLRAAAHTAVALVQGKNLGSLVDRLGQRLAFERTAVRLYEALLIKLDTMGTWEGGPSAIDLVYLHEDGRRHFEQARLALEELGADPTAQTPAADVAAVACGGVLQVLNDPRTTTAQCLDVMLMAELADSAGWELLAELARALEHTELADAFTLTHHRVAGHAGMLRAWLVAYLRHDAHGELSMRV